MGCASRPDERLPPNACPSSRSRRLGRKTRRTNARQGLEDIAPASGDMALH